MNKYINRCYTFLVPIVKTIYTNLLSDVHVHWAPCNVIRCFSTSEPCFWITLHQPAASVVEEKVKILEDTKMCIMISW